MSRDDPTTPSLAHEELAPLWRKIRVIRAGVEAVRDEALRQGTKSSTRTHMDEDGRLFTKTVPARGQYLPQYEAEDLEEYLRRLHAAPWRPEFDNAVRIIAAKPFTKEVRLTGGASQRMLDIAEDVDGAGNNLHVFSKNAFEEAVAMGACGILVDYPTMDPNASLAEERESGARPYWLLLDADQILSVRERKENGRTIVEHLRFKETVTRHDGFAEYQVERVRVIEPGAWWIYTKNGDAPSGWDVESGEMTLSEVPFKFVCAGKKRGSQHVKPPLADLAEMQLELFRALSREDEILTYAGSPMLAAEGMAPPDGESVKVGPKTILYTASGGEGPAPRWLYVQPDAQNIREVREGIGSIIKDIRTLGMQPLMPTSGVVSATTSATEASKAHSAAQAWALGLKDVLEQCFVFTAMWMKETAAPVVMVHTDFSVGVYGEAEMRELSQARGRGDISRKTWWDEMGRRGVLGPQFDPTEEEARIAAEPPVPAQIVAEATAAAKTARPAEAA